VLKRFDPKLPTGEYSQVVLSDERDLGAKVSPWAKSAELFRGTLAVITPLIWLTYFFSSFAIYLKASFGVLFMEELGIERMTAANIASISSFIGAIGGVVLLWFTERRGPAWIAIAPLLGVPLALWIGSGVLLDGPLFIPVILLGGIMIGTGHAAVISINSIYYPSAVRATGGGWASFMAKFAAVAAPIIAGWYFLADKDAVLDGYLFTGLCLAGVVLGLLVLSVYARRLMAEQAAVPAQPVAA
jgi:MFS transporter, AAHS family, 4-hydroxybenzoate transporter